MPQCTAIPPDRLGAMLHNAGVKNIRTYDVSKTHVSYILSDILRFKGLLLGSCAYNTYMHPMMEHLCNEIKIMSPKNKVMGIFGTSGWNGAGAKAIAKVAQEQNINTVLPIVEALGAPTESKISATAQEFVNNFSKAVKE